MTAENRLVILVEDDTADAMFFERAMRAEGFHNPLIVLHTAEEATMYLSGSGPYANRERFPLPQLVVIDLSLPGRNGLHLAQWIRQRAEGSQPNIVVLGGSGSPAEAAEALSLGVNAYHPKPQTSDELRPLVKRMLDFWLLGGPCTGNGPLMFANPPPRDGAAEDR
jgi:DNA-binding response OmpR family regulator